MAEVGVAVSSTTMISQHRNVQSRRIHILPPLKNLHLKKYHAMTNLLTRTHQQYDFYPLQGRHNFYLWYEFLNTENNRHLII